MKIHKVLGVFGATVALTISGAVIACEDTGLCPSEADYQAIADKGKEAAAASKDKLNAAMDEAAKKAFAPKEEFFGGECLEGIKKLNIDLQLLDPRNLGKMQVVDMIKDYFKKTACAIVVQKANEQLDKIQEDIDEVGTMMKDDGLNDYGIGLSTTRGNGRDGGLVGGSATVNQVQDTKAMEDFGQAANEGMNRLLFGGADMDEDGNVTFDKSQDEVNELVNGRNFIDLTDDKYYGDGDGGYEGSKKEGTITSEEVANDMQCYFAPDSCTSESSK